MEEAKGSSASNSAGSDASREWRVPAALLLLAGAMLGTLAYARSGSGSGGHNNESSLLRVLSFSASRKSKITKREKSNYGFQRVGYDLLPYFGDDADDTINYAILDGMDGVIEPNVPMQFQYFGDGLKSDYYFKIQVMIDSTGEELGTGYLYPSASSKDQPVTCDCEPLTELRVDVSEYNSKGDAIKTFNLKTMCMYVRRELRSLTADDLSKTMDAMYTLWQYTDEEGQPTYGKDYHGIVYFSSMHHFNAAWQDGDHIHEGLGFLPQHIKMTNLFEKAMQAVDPSVSLFYWDFTIDSTEDTTLFDSPMFTADTFGSLTASKGEGDEQWYWSVGDAVSDGYIPDGRWAKAKAIRNPFEEYMASAYGFMRGPWCMNPSSRVTRYPLTEGSSFQLSLPSCRTYVSWLEDDDKMSFLKTAEDNPHAVAHGMIGGVFGCDKLKELQDAGILDSSSSSMATVCYKWSFYMKELYRAGVMQPKTNCVSKELGESNLFCGFTCDDDDAASWIKSFSGFSISNHVPEDAVDDDATWETWRQFVCNGKGYLVFTGDQLESASPNDPSFWPIHPTQERLLQAKMMAGGFTETEWPTTTCSAKNCDWVCNHAKCYDYTGENTEKGYYYSCCAGHFENDQLLDYTTGDRSQGIGSTNSQVFLDVDPTSDDYANTYVYDHFEWTHCGDEEVKDVRSKILSLAEEKNGRRSRGLRS